MNLKHIESKILLKNLMALVKKEREVTLEVLHHLREVERRSLFAELGFSSLFEYAVKDLRYSESAAQRRISSMRLLKEIPELETKIESGALSLSSLSQAQRFFRQERTQSATEKKEVLLNLENKSYREVEKELVARSTEPARLNFEKQRQVTPFYTEIKILVDEKTLKQIEELKNLLAHSRPGATTREILELTLKMALEKLKPKSPKMANPDEEVISRPAPVVKQATRYVSTETKRKVWARDTGQCTYRNNETNKRCSCKYGLEVDHIQPFALGGPSTIENLRLRCKAHNQLAAIKTYGQLKMQNYVPRLRE